MNYGYIEDKRGTCMVLKKDKKKDNSTMCLIWVYKLEQQNIKGTFKIYIITIIKSIWHYD